MGQSYRDLVVWRKAMDLVTEIYASTRTFPRDELYGLTSQLRRALLNKAGELGRILNGLIAAIRAA